MRGTCKRAGGAANRRSSGKEWLPWSGPKFDSELRGGHSNRSSRVRPRAPLRVRRARTCACTCVCACPGACPWVRGCACARGPVCACAAACVHVVRARVPSWLRWRAGPDSFSVGSGWACHSGSTLKARPAHWKHGTGLATDAAHLYRLPFGTRLAGKVANLNGRLSVFSRTASQGLDSKPTVCNYGTIEWKRQQRLAHGCEPKESAQ